MDGSLNAYPVIPTSARLTTYAVNAAVVKLERSFEVELTCMWNFSFVSDLERCFGSNRSSASASWSFLNGLPRLHTTMVSFL